MSELFATDPTGRSHAQQNGDPLNLVSLQEIFDDWAEGNWGLGRTVTDEQVAALCQIPTERIQAVLDAEYGNRADELWDILNSIRQKTSDALLKQIGAI